MRHLMLDIETTGTAAGCRLLTIGAIDTQGNEFYERISYHSYPDSFVDSPDTMEWWDKQEPHVRKEAFGGTREARLVLTKLRTYVEDTDCDLIWCKGASFDFPIIDYVSDFFGEPRSFEFWKLRCARTVYSLAGVKSQDYMEGDAHNALDDSVAQLHALSASYAALGLDF